MTKKRERLEVIYDILQVIMEKNNYIRPTPLMRYSNLSSQRFAEYFQELITKEFIKEVEEKKGRKFISLSDKGFRYLERYQTITGFIDEFEL